MTRRKSHLLQFAIGGDLVLGIDDVEVAAATDEKVWEERYPSPPTVQH